MKRRLSAVQICDCRAGCDNCLCNCDSPVGCSRCNLDLLPQVKPDLVNRPPHYTSSKARCECGRGIECIDVTRHLSFNIGNAIKYLWRVDLKNSAIEDLKKAAWYINDEITKRSQV